MQDEISGLLLVKPSLSIHLSTGILGLGWGLRDIDWPLLFRVSSSKFHTVDINKALLGTQRNLEGFFKCVYHKTAACKPNRSVSTLYQNSITKEFNDISIGERPKRKRLDSYQMPMDMSNYVQRIIFSQSYVYTQFIRNFKICTIIKTTTIFQRAILYCPNSTNT